MSSSVLTTVAVGVIIGLALIGTLVFIASRRGWMRNGYFTSSATILVVLGIFIAFQSLGSMLVVAIGGFTLDESNVTMLAMNGAAQLLIMLVGTVVVSLALRQNSYVVFRLEGFHRTPWIAYILSIPIMFAAQFAGEAVSSIWAKGWRLFPAIYPLLNKLESANDKQMEALVTAHGLGEFVLIFLFVAVIPAFAEETLFRGFAMTNIEHSGRSRTRPIYALFLSSALFAAIHLSVFKFPGLLSLGLALGYMASRTNNLFVGSLGHAANNGIIVIALYLAPGLDTGASASSLIGTADMPMIDALLMLGGSLPALALLIYVFHRATEGIEPKHPLAQE
ncbi:MAG: CPBP family intramembrane metalloprotease [Bacteroidota bacterium]|nr:CPBP family intramembrane metalloprotease [Bacteroidota bacterium]MDP4234347.1 CPBP family intramembrane metalloprotease [Bacteroidota bacterium]MDP4243281.1 CPBP family intramembrane metalloprotease [Bacteroidota bacterium]MDP4289106.1 CPBP family intramembrane metalloprotease [Bacteroidota bacterium]